MGKKEERICTTDDVQLQKPKTGCISAFLAILTAVLEKPQNLGFVFYLEVDSQDGGGQKGKKTEER